MHRGCIWAAVAFTGLVLLVLGVILPRSIQHAREEQPKRTSVPTASATR